ncbi:hypothetical protein [Lacisediminihabitans sp.]|uniref:hypothetical protein n=1 Tax=Lacisediminihabitans sp. TaxID=2787631 RepID=UPI00374CECDD
MPSEPTQDNTPDNETTASSGTEDAAVTAETSAAPAAPAAPAPTATHPGYAASSPAPASRPRRGLVIAGAIVGAVVILGATFGGGVLVGSVTHHDGPSMRQADRAPGDGQRGDRPDHGFMGPRDGQQGSNGRGYPGN